MSEAIPSGVTVVDHPLVRIKLTRLREKNTRPEEFRARLAELAMVLVVDATRDLATRAVTIDTPLAPCEGAELERPLVIVPILRAGLGFAEGMIRVLAEASFGHIGMRRDEETHRPHCYYCNLPPKVEESEVIVVDPMLATGHTSGASITRLKEAGARRIRFVCAVSCPEGIRQMRSEHPDVPIYTGVIDERLNDRAYIVPGLGDAGDRYFGTL